MLIIIYDSIKDTSFKSKIGYILLTTFFFQNDI